MLDKNGIQYASGSGTAKGYNYFSGKDETFTIGKEDVLINVAQPQSTLITVLFEPKAVLVDSVTYDITAWSLPYIYGVNGYAVKEKLNTTGAYSKAPKIVNTVADTYGYVIPWEGVQSAKVVSELIQKGVKLRFASGEFEVSGKAFKPGAVIVLKTANSAVKDDLWHIVTTACNGQQVNAYPVNTGFVDKGYDFGSSNVKYLKPPKVAMLTGEGTYSNAAGEIWFFIERELNYPVTLINISDIGRAEWNDIDVLIMPDGNYAQLGEKGRFDVVKDWISKGGKVIALESAVAFLSKMETGLKFKNDDDTTDKKDPYKSLKKFGDFERDFISSTTPGSILKVQLDNTHPLAFGYPDYYYTLKMDDKVYEFINEGWNVGVIKKDNIVAGFVGARLKKKLNDGLIFGVQDVNRGNIVYLADNVLFRNFWQNGKLLFCNALFLVGR